MRKIYDFIILGAGPAGITAAVYSARKMLDFLIISSDIGGQAAISGDIENYTGYQFITGPELAIKFQEHMNSFGIRTKIPEEVKDIQKKGKLIKVLTNKAEYLAKAVVVATGKRSRELKIEGEKEFKNKGLSYCATCDGPLFRNKRVVVVGGGNSALDAALQLLKISPKVYIVNIKNELTGDSVMIEKVEESTKVSILNNTKVQRIFGKDFVEGIEVETKGITNSLDVEGIFVEIGLIPNSEISKILEKNEFGEIVVDCYNRTNVEGIFAAGDVTNVVEKQIIIACGEGSKASLSAVKYLSTHKLQ